MKKLSLILLLALASGLCYAEPTESLTDKGVSQKGLYFVLNQMKNSMNNRPQDRCQIKIGSNTLQLMTVYPAYYTINGSYTTRVATSAINYSLGHTTMTASQTCHFALCLDSAGAFYTYQGPILDIASKTWHTPKLPRVPNERAQIGLILIRGVFEPRGAPMTATNTVIMDMVGEPIRFTDIPK